MKVGDRIELVEMTDDPAPIEPGSLGTVEGIVDMPHYKHVHVRWDNGRMLSLCVPPDVVVVLIEPLKEGA